MSECGSFPMPVTKHTRGFQHHWRRVLPISSPGPHAPSLHKDHQTVTADCQPRSPLEDRRVTLRKVWIPAAHEVSHSDTFPALCSGQEPPSPQPVGNAMPGRCGGTHTFTHSLHPQHRLRSLLPQLLLFSVLDT